MSVNSGTYGSVDKTTPPFGLKLICVFLGGMTILGFLFMLITFPTMFPGEAAAVGIIVGGILSLINLIILFFLYQLNRIAYIIFMFFTAINLLFGLVSFNILTLIIQGPIFAYLLTINEYF